MEAYLRRGQYSSLAWARDRADAGVFVSRRHQPDEYVEPAFGTGGLLIEHELPADGENYFTVKGMTG